MLSAFFLIGGSEKGLVSGRTGDPRDPLIELSDFRNGNLEPREMT